MEATSLQLDRLNMDASGLGTSNTNTPHISRTSRMHQKTTAKATKPVGVKTKGPLDDLNRWEFCDPDRAVDVLPQPFRFINDIIEESLMFSVNKKIDQIDELKLNPSYEGNVNRIPPSGAYEIDGITCFSQEENSLGYVLAGDEFGYVYLLDIENKARLAKFDTKTKKPISQVIMHTVKYGDRIALIFFVVYIHRFEVDGFMMMSHDLINIKKIFSFGDGNQKNVPKDDKKAASTPIQTGAKKLGQKDQPKLEKEEESPAKETLDQYPMVVDCY